MGVNYVKNILVRNIGDYFILYLIAVLLLVYSFFVYQGKCYKFFTNLLYTYFSFLFIDYFTSNKYFKKPTFYKVNDKKVETTIKYIKPDTHNNHVGYHFYFKSNKNHYPIKNVILIFNKLKDIT